MIFVLFETPSGFALLTMFEGDLKLPDALQNIWASFAMDYKVEEFIWLSAFREFKDKSSVINHDTGVSWDLTEMIIRWRRPGQKMAVGKPEYKEIIERSLGVPCLFDEIVMEVMWGLKNLMHFLVPHEKMKLRDEDRLPISQGMKMLLNRYDFDIKPEMVNEGIILLACLVLDCEYCDVKNSKPLRLAGEHLKDVSGINSEDWDLMKLATVMKIVAYPAERTTAEEAMFTRDEVLTFVRDSHKYEARIHRGICMNVYNEMVEARVYIRAARRTLESILPKIEQSA